MNVYNLHFILLRECRDIALQTCIIQYTSSTSEYIVRLRVINSYCFLALPEKLVALQALRPARQKRGAVYQHFM